MEMSAYQHGWILHSLMEVSMKLQKGYTSEKTTLQRTAKTSPKSHFRGSSLYQENNGPSLHYSPKANTILKHEVPRKEAQRPEGPREWM